jgi:hypothetical protein
MTVVPLKKAQTASITPRPLIGPIPSMGLNCVFELGGNQIRLAGGRNFKCRRQAKCIIDS